MKNENTIYKNSELVLQFFATRQEAQSVRGHYTALGMPSRQGRLQIVQVLHNAKSLE
jgi:hypothetical protein